MREQAKPGALARQYIRTRGLLYSWVAEQMGISKQHLANTLDERYAIPRSFWPRLHTVVRFSDMEIKELVKAGVPADAFDGERVPA